MDRTLRTASAGTGIDFSAPAAGDPATAVGTDAPRPGPERTLPVTALGMVLAALRGRPEDVSSVRRRREHRERHRAEQDERLLRAGLLHLY